MASVVDISTTFSHKTISEFRALHKFDTSVVIFLEDLSQITVGNGSVSWLVSIRWAYETTVVGVTHWEVWSQVLIEGTLSAEGLR